MFCIKKTSLYLAPSLKLLVLFAALSFFTETEARATKKPEEIPAVAGVVEKLDDIIDLDLIFTTSKGETLPLRRILKPQRPTIIVPVYYRCPRLCSLTLNGLLDGLRDQDLQPGEDFNIATVSFAEGEKHPLAASKQKAYLSALLDEPGKLEGELDKASLEKGWQFLTGEPDPVKKLMNQVGFNYVLDGDEYSHSSAMMLVSPTGKITHYIYGFPLKGKSLRLALIEASEGIIGSAFDRILLYCFRFDPTKGQYSLAILKLLQVVGGLTLLGLGTMIFILKKQESI